MDFSIPSKKVSLVVVIKTKMSSQKLYIIRTQCMRVIIIFFGTPSPTLGVSTILSIYVNPALNCSYQPTYCSAHRFPSGYISLKSNLCSRWRDPSLSLRPSGPGNILLPAPCLWPPEQNCHPIPPNEIATCKKTLKICHVSPQNVPPAFPQRLEQSHQADFNLTPDIFAKSGLQVFYEVDLCHNHGIIWAATSRRLVIVSLSPVQHYVQPLPLRHQSFTSSYPTSLRPHFKRASTTYP